MGKSTQAPSEETLLQMMTLYLQSKIEQKEHAQRPVDPEPSTNETMNVKEAAPYLGISEWTLRDMVRGKEIVFHRIRTRIFFKRRELDRWINQQQQGVIEAGAQQTEVR